MYAIVEINGQQFKAEEGKKLFVHHIKEAEEGQAVEFDKVLLVDNDGTQRALAIVLAIWDTSRVWVSLVL